MHSDGSGGNDLSIPASGSAELITVEALAANRNKIQQNGKVVFQHAIRRMAEVCSNLMKTHNITADDVDLLVPHQANRRILEPTAERLGIPLERVVINIELVANTTAGTIPLALDEAFNDGRLKPGSRVLLAAFGGGLTWGACYFTWGR